MLSVRRREELRKKHMDCGQADIKKQEVSLYTHIEITVGGSLVNWASRVFFKRLGLWKIGSTENGHGLM